MSRARRLADTAPHCFMRDSEKLTMDEAIHPLVKLAHQAVDIYVRDGRRLAPPDELVPEMRQRAGTFVSIHEFGELRGCIGTFLPVRENVAEEVIENAIASASRDPRFPPVQPGEL